MHYKAPLPVNELERIIALADFNLDFSSFENNFKDLTRLAAKVAGTDMSFINLIDTYTTWTISSHGMEVEQTPREESVCQYTITENDHFEVSDLTKDSRFSERPFVTDEPKLRYYYGVPLKAGEHNIGALCVMDTKLKSLSPEKTELLQIIADDIINRLSVYKMIETLKNEVAETKTTQNKVVHDIRGPLSGIIGLAQFISSQGDRAKMDDVLSMMNLIYKSGNSILELADEILSNDKKEAAPTRSDEFNLLKFQEKLNKLYIPQAKGKQIDLQINISKETEAIAFPKNKLLQITGNLISNAIKFTPNNGIISVDLQLFAEDNNNNLLISVKDNGVGLSKEEIENIFMEQNQSTKGTEGEHGYGFGLVLVKHLVQGLKGTLSISSAPEEGALFEIRLPL